MAGMIYLDGSFGEGGGQIVRTALGLSCLTGKAFEVVNIRKGRCDPGLKMQHLHCIKALQTVSQADATGACLGSTTLTFKPNDWKPASLDIDIETAGSVTLFLQGVVLPFFLGKKKVTIAVTGGTDVPWSMPVDYFKHVVVPHLIKWADVEVTISQRGYYPKGGGRVEVHIKPRFNLTSAAKAPRVSLLHQGKLVHIRGVSHASKDLESARVADRQANAASFVLEKLGVPVHILSEYSDAHSTGSGICTWGIFGEPSGIDPANPIRMGSDALGARGKRAEDVGIEAAESLKREIAHCSPVDEHLADNLIPLLAIFGGCMRIPAITNHVRANLYVVQQFLGKESIALNPTSLIIESNGFTAENTPP